MTDRQHDKEEMLDRIAAEIRADQLEDEAVTTAVDRVWRRIATEDGGGVPVLRGCDDFRALIPELVDGTLPTARALLLEDHSKECVSCRRALMEARGQVAPPSAARRKSATAGVPVWLRLAAAAVVLLGLGVVGTSTIGKLIVERNLVATVESSDGTLRLFSDNASFPLTVGDTVHARQVLRTTKGSDAVIRIADGTTVEMGARSELTLRGSLRGNIVELERGNIIVHAAKQGRRRLYVETADCLVAVRGTIFAVDHGLKGSRVSVIEGEVEVRQRGERDYLAPGEQVTTSDSLLAVSVERQISWSRNAEQHVALLRELTALHRDVADAMEPETSRTATRLLDLAPSDTLIYVAVPNLTDGLDEARQILDERLASSELLQMWWREQVAVNGLDREIDVLFDRLQSLGEAVGDEVVIAVPADAIDGHGGPLVMAVLEDPASFEAQLSERLSEINTDPSNPAAVLIDDPLAAAHSDAELLLWVHDDLFAAATSMSLLRDLASHLADPDSDTFVGSELHARLADVYRGGVSWLIGVDGSALLSRAASSCEAGELSVLERLGVMNTSTFVVERHRAKGSHVINGELNFEGPRHGIAAWLAAPAPMGSLEFVSPNASLVSAVVSKDAADMFAELVAAIAAADPGVLAEFQNLEGELAFDVGIGLATAIGGEAAFAVDGPVLPIPAWKLIVEVYDPATLQATIETAVAELDRHLVDQGRPGLKLVSTTEGGVTYHTIRHDDTTIELAYTVVDGFLVMAPSRALIDQALQYRSTGLTLTRTAAFRDLLPDNGYTDCSALFYRNLALLADALPTATQLIDVPPEMVQLLHESSEPNLLCVYGENDRILMSGTGGSLFGAFPALGLSNAMRHFEPALHDQRETLSSQG